MFDRSIILNTCAILLIYQLSATAVTKPPEQISFNAWKTILILCGTIVIFLYLNTAMSPALPSIAEDFQISTSLCVLGNDSIHGFWSCHDCYNGKVIRSCWSQENANDNDDMFYRRNYLGTFCS